MKKLFNLYRHNVNLACSAAFLMWDKPSDTFFFIPCPWRLIKLVILRSFKMLWVNLSTCKTCIISGYSLSSLICHNRTWPLGPLIRSPFCNIRQQPVYCALDLVIPKTAYEPRVAETSKTISKIFQSRNIILVWDALKNSIQNSLLRYFL